MRTTGIARLFTGMMIFMLVLSGVHCDRRKDISPVLETPGIAVKPLGVKTVNEALRILYVDAAAIDTLNGRLTFRFYVDDENDMVIRGWRDNFDKNPPIVFPQPSALSNAKIISGSYLGNILLNANVLQAIKRKVGTGAGKFAFLKLVPEIDSRPGSEGQIIYKMFYTNKSPVFRTAMLGNDSLLSIYDTIMAPPPTGDEDSGFMLNPSPPRKDTDQ